ncbi:hypothetical protein JKP88DRAFT_241320 [Tribonema minus]|uniref:DNA polymerase n=1 Tax=Tribonema minus TaxID=303371 RepID=A0A836CFB4_9STRA|nr:hypothetical protein JKP88DRAFT_241320 [Tribonema minus]
MTRKVFLLHVGFEPNPAFDSSAEWWQQDQPKRIIWLVGKGEDGRRAVIQVPDWRPWAMAKRLPHDSPGFAAKLADSLKTSGCVSARVVRRRQFVGFTDLQVADYAQLRFKTWPVFVCSRDTSLLQLSSARPGVSARLLETDVRPANKFMHETGLRCGAWFEWPGLGSPNTRDLVPISDECAPPPLLYMAYDLETSGLDPQKCRIHQVCLIFWSTSDGSVQDAIKRLEEAGGEGQAARRVMPPLDPRTVVLCTQPTDSVDGTPVEVLADEKALLLRMSALISRHDPDVLLQFNGSCFDNGFIRTRMSMYKDMTGFQSIARIPGVKAFFKDSELTNAALGTNARTLWNVPGRLNLDLYAFAKSTLPGEPSYRMGVLGEKYCGGGKDDVHFGQILHAFGPEGTPAERGVIARYCCIDGYVCLQLNEVWSTTVSVFEEAAACAVTASTILDTGRQCKVVSLIQAELHGEYVWNPPPPLPEGSASYQGATVIDPAVGFYGGPLDQVALLDFASLYPSLMRAYDICPSRLVRRGVAAEVAAAARPGVVTTEYDLGNGTVVTLAKPSDPNAPPPKLTIVLEKLLRERALVRAQLKTETDPLRRDILDCRQKAKKVAANSTYGILGASKGFLPLPELAAVTTLMGRRSLEFTQTAVERDFGARVIAGDTDSVMILLPEGEGPKVPPSGEVTEEWKSARMAYVFEKAAAIADDVSARLPEPLELELEGVMYPSAFYKKKRYAAKLWPGGKMKMKGVTAVRNDGSALVKRLCSRVLTLSIGDNDPHGAVQHVLQALRDMRGLRLPMTDFVISKELHSFEPKVISPHVALARRIRDMAARDVTVEVPVLGAKVSYVVVKGGGDVHARSRRPEDVTPEQLDLDFYFDNQLVRPLVEMMAPFIAGGAKELRRLLGNVYRKQATVYAALGVAAPALAMPSARLPSATPPAGQPKKRRADAPLERFWG